MHRFWDTIIEPILSIIRPQSIVEIGAENGANTANILRYCSKYNSKLHSIDPFPKFDADEWVTKQSDFFIFHRSLSLSAIPKINQMDVVLIDGDHNWYTVFNELRLIEHQCKKNDVNFPLVLFHDTGWPYGRRDLYYNPDNIPDIHRKPYIKKGISPGVSDLDDTGILNAHLNNAVYENDLHNGVLTAIEDFIDQTSLSLGLITIPGLNGFGIVVPNHLKETTPQIATFINTIKLTPALKTIIENVEKGRITEQIRAIKMKNDLTRVEQKMVRTIDAHKNELLTQKMAIDNLRATINEQQVAINQKDTRYEKLNTLHNKTTKILARKNRHLQQTIRWIDQLLVKTEAIHNSKTWRIGRKIIGTYNRLIFRSWQKSSFDGINQIANNFRVFELNDNEDKFNFDRTSNLSCRKEIPFKKKKHQKLLG